MSSQSQHDLTLLNKFIRKIRKFFQQNIVILMCPTFFFYFETKTIFGIFKECYIFMKKFAFELLTKMCDDSVVM